MHGDKPHALITGAAKRVGRVLSLRLAEAGYRITIHYRHSREDAETLLEEVRAIGGEGALVHGDLAEADAPTRVVEEACAAQGPVQLLVHNASLFARDRLDTVTYETLEAHMRVNLYPALLLTQAMTARLPEGRGGHIIALSDGMQGWSISSQFLSYSLSKLALEQWAMLSARSLAPHIRVNVVAPGATLQGQMESDALFDKITRATPLRRDSSPEEVAQAVLALEQLPSVTGQVIRLSGGMHLPCDSVV